MTEELEKQFVYLCAVRALIGEVTPNMRCVAFGSNESARTAKFIFYMAETPSELEKEIAEIVALNFNSEMPCEMSSIDIEIIDTHKPFADLDALDLLIFCRREDSTAP